MMGVNDTAIEFEARGQSDFWFACVDIEVIRDKNLTPCDKAVFAVICSYANVQTRQWVLKVQTIADDAGCGVRTVQKSLQSLVDRGVIERTVRFENGKQKASSYRIVGHRAKCYETATDEQAENRGAKSAGYVENCTPRGAESAPLLLEPVSYENKTYSPTESAETAPEESVSRPVEISEISAAMRPTVDLFLLKTGRANIDESELIPLRYLERDHYPTRINQEIRTAVERFRRRGRDPTTLTFDYLYESLKHQSSRKPKPRLSAEEKKRAERERAENIALERERREEFEAEVNAFFAAKESGGEGYETFPGSD